MIIGAEIGLLIMGIIALCTGKMSMGGGKEVLGWKARLIGFIALLPFTLAFAIGFVGGFLAAANGVQFDAASVQVSQISEDRIGKRCVGFPALFWHLVWIPLLHKVPGKEADSWNLLNPFSIC